MFKLRHRKLVYRFLIHKFPTIKYFRDGQPVREFNGDYHTDEILKFLQDPSKLKIAPKQEHASHHQQDEGVPKYWKGVPGGDKVVHFTDFNYKQLLQNNPSILLMFYVPWYETVKFTVSNSYYLIMINLTMTLGLRHELYII